MLKSASVLKNPAKEKDEKKKKIHLLVPFTVQQGMESFGDVGILIECFNCLVCKYVGSRLCLESIEF